ncbi:hypothetical protein [Spirosoma foliorum]|uniref:Uncharacterized protein n=1 Tax=Spirosoma foliorum TaxID=2710596 RepID=A0A7G5H1E2_9BACT|nr:hypothetical protein [Spirosoma foliorum]QMW04934.1 hypothetical protein H3H32_08560 [Spirosoma foliorum]
MATLNKTASDWTVILLGVVGFLLGAEGILNPHFQYKMLGLTALGNVIPALLGSASLSASYVGILYIVGVIHRWKHVKRYLIGARLLMGVGFLGLMAIGRMPQTYRAAAVWEIAGALLIAGALWWDMQHEAN